MGKKKDKSKKGKGAEKTALKTEKKANKKNKKLLSEKGEEDIEKLIAEFQNSEDRQKPTVELKVDRPSPRCNASLTANVEKDELVLFGGEYYNGKQTLFYNDLLFYNIKREEWTQVKAPNPPPPRSAHQAAFHHQSGGQLWVFGGEFASKTQSQFYHYKDLWVFHFKEKRWESLKSSNKPPARSGHRMVACKRNLIVFGGFNDNIRSYTYFNDVHVFSLDTYTWSKVNIEGQGPSPRSGLQMLVSPNQNYVLLYGGYSKSPVKRDIDKGHTHSDMFKLALDSKSKDAGGADKWRWYPLKQHGDEPRPRCGFSLVTLPNKHAFMFGGIFDEEEDEENVEGVNSNEMFSLDIDKSTWYPVMLKGKKDTKEKKRRRKVKDLNEDGGEGEEDGGDSDEDVGEDFEKLQMEDLDEDGREEEDMADVQEGSVAVLPQADEEDSIFKVTLGSGGSNTPGGSTMATSGATCNIFVPCPRMNAAMTVHKGVIYMYGGIVEQGDKQITLGDMYSLDSHKMEEWNTIIPLDKDTLEYYDSESDEDNKEEGSDDSDSDMDEDIPRPNSGENMEDYVKRTSDFWLQEARDMAADSKKKYNEEQLKVKALKFSRAFYQEEMEESGEAAGGGDSMVT